MKDKAGNTPNANTLAHVSQARDNQTPAEQASERLAIARQQRTMRARHNPDQDSERRGRQEAREPAEPRTAPSRFIQAQEEAHDQHAADRANQERLATPAPSRDDQGR